MTREEAIEYLDKLYMKAEITDVYGDMDDTEPYETAIDMATEALGFTEWVAKIIFNEDMDYDAFAELACRRLEKLGAVKADGDKWVLEVGEEE